MTPKLRSYLIVIITLLITIGPMLYGNIVAKKGGLMDDSLLNHKDPYYLFDQQVKSFKTEGMKTGDPVAFVIPFTNGPTADSLAFVKKFTDDLKEKFPEFGILSLSIAANYHDTGTELLHEPYISGTTLETLRSNPAAATEQWKAEIARDPAVYGLLIGKKFDHAIVTMLLPEGYDEIGVFRRTTEFLEQRSIPLWEWYLKNDIKPAGAYSRVLPAGWVVGRGLTDAALISDILTLSTVGLCIVAVAFFFSLITFRQTVIATSVVMLSFIWIRGSLGLLQLAGCNLYERVYFLLVYTALIISGISFAERKFSSYNDVRADNPDLSRSEVWRLSRPVNELILMTGIISILNFGTLYQIQIRGILEIGIFSALGICYLLLLVLLYIPALHIIIGGETRPTALTWSDHFGARWNGLMKKVVLTCHKLVDPGYPDATWNYRKAARRYLLLTGATVFVAVGLVSLDYLPGIHKVFQFVEIKTRALEFIRKTVVYKASEVLNKPGNYGFDRISVLIMPKNAGTEAPVYSPEFLKRVEAFSREAAKLPDVNQANSIVDSVKVVSRESYKRDLPVTSQQAHDILQTIEWDLGPQVKEQLWFDRGVTLFASTSKDDTTVFAAISKNLIELAAKQFPDLEILPFGKMAIYPHGDHYISVGKPVNILTSQWIVVVVTVPWILWRNRRFGSAHSPIMHPERSRRELYGWRTGLVTNIPFVFASAAIVIVMIVMRVPLDQATACTTALAINAAVDFGLYLTADFQTAVLEGQNVREGLHYALVDRGKVIVMDIVLNSLCFIPLMTSSFLPVMRLGWIMIVMLLACGFGALVIMPALLPWCVKNKVVEETP